MPPAKGVTFNSAAWWCNLQAGLTLSCLQAIRNHSDDMRAQQINRVSSKALIVLSLIALLAVLSGYTQAPQPDEGTAAHIFQLTIVALVPMIVLFLATADWRQPLRENSLLDQLAGAVAQGRVVFRLLALEDAGGSDHVIGYVGAIEPLKGIFIESGGRQ